MINHSPTKFHPNGTTHSKVMTSIGCTQIFKSYKTLKRLRFKI